MLLLLVSGCWRSGVVLDRWTLAKWCCWGSMDVREVVLLVVSGCWRSSVVGCLWMLKDWCCWSVDVEGVVLSWKSGVVLGQWMLEE